jgi:hypothetical protein
MLVKQYFYEAHGALSTSTRSPSNWSTNESGFARMIDVQQIAVQVEMRIATSLHSSVCGLADARARRKFELCKDGKGRERNARDTFGSEFLGVDDYDLLDLGVGGLVPVGSERSHCWWFRVACEALEMGWIAKDMS